MIKRYIGDRAFYKMALTVALPMMIQNAVTNFVSLLDNIMVGRVGTLQMTGVSVVNQLLFVYNLCIFGAVAGAGIFTAQFYGQRDDEGIRQTFRFKIMICAVIGAVGIALLLLRGEALISLYLNGEATAAERGGAAALTAAERADALRYGREYLAVMLIGLVPFTFNNAYASSMRETGQTVVPMVSGLAAVAVNMSLNYVLIFGKLGMPVLGVKGAAIATVISRYTELAVNAAWLHSHGKRYPYIKGVYRSLRIALPLLEKITLKGMPLLVNEALWSASVAVLNQCYSTRGLNVVAANNIASTLWNLFSVCFISLGSATGIIIGQMLGAGRSPDEVRDCDRKLIAFSVTSCAVFGLVMAAVSGIFPLIYKTDEAVRSLATSLICINSVIMPFNAYANAAYFTLRSGGKTLSTLLFDSCFVWVVSVPLAFSLSRFTGVPILPLYTVCQGAEILKCVIGFVMLKRGTWIRNIVVKE